MIPYTMPYHFILIANLVFVSLFAQTNELVSHAYDINNIFPVKIVLLLSLSRLHQSLDILETLPYDWKTDNVK